MRTGFKRKLREDLAMRGFIERGVTKNPDEARRLAKASVTADARHMARSLKSMKKSALVCNNLRRQRAA